MRNGFPDNKPIIRFTKAPRRGNHKQITEPDSLEPGRNFGNKKIKMKPYFTNEESEA